MRQEKYDDWVNEAYQYIKKVYPIVSQLENVNMGSTQYISKIDGDIDIEFVFLGHDAHEGLGIGEKMDITFAKERFFEGNGNPIYWRKQKEWKIWNNIETAFRRIGFTEIMNNGFISEEKLKRTIVTNALFFNYSKANAKELNKELNKCVKADIVNECMKLTGKLIFDVIKPKMVICSSCSLVFEPLIMNYKKNYNKDISYKIFHLEGTKKKVMRCIYNDIIVLGIPHTSYPVPLPVAAFVRDSYLGKDVGYTMSYVTATPTPTINPMNKRTYELKKLICKNGSIQDIFEERILYHEYFTTIKSGKYVTSSDRIVIDLTPEEDKNQYVVLIFTRQNDETKTKELIKGIWPDEDFNPWSEHKARHIHKVIPFCETNEHIAEIMEQVLLDVKTYRDKEFPLNK